MKTSTYIKMLLAASIATFSFAVNAATLNLINPVEYFTPAGPPGNTATIETVVNINDYMPGASQGYYISGAIPNAVDANQLQTEFNAASAGFTITDFVKLDPPTGNVFDSSSLGIAFQGFLMKVGNFTLIGLFDTPISQLSYNNDGLKGISHVAYFNTSSVSAVPVPAALWLFAPALMGFLGFRRRLTK